MEFLYSISHAYLANGVAATAIMQNAKGKSSVESLIPRAIIHVLTWSSSRWLPLLGLEGATERMVNQGQLPGKARFR